MVRTSSTSHLVSHLYLQSLAYHSSHPNTLFKNRGIRRQGYVCSGTTLASFYIIYNIKYGYVFILVLECQYSVHPKCKKLAILSETCKAVQEKSSSFVSPFSSSSISIPASPTNSNQNTPSPSPHKLSSSQPSPTIQFTTSNPASPINGRPQQSSNSAQTTPTTSFELSDASLSINSPNDSVTNSEMSECEDSPEEPVLEEFQHQCMFPKSYSPMAPSSHLSSSLSLTNLFVQSPWNSWICYILSSIYLIVYREAT